MKRIADIPKLDRPREKLQQKGAESLSDLAHNHTAGGLRPSNEDIEITRQLKSAGETLGIRLLDHIIFDHKGYYSFLENGSM